MRSNITVVAGEIKRRLAGDDNIDLEFLAQLFEDDTIDAGRRPWGNDLQNRLRLILNASTDGSFNGVTHFAGIYDGCKDRGFRKAFQDRWESSRNQVGHFTTAVDMGFRPEQTYAILPYEFRLAVASIWRPGPLSPQEIACITLIIGHEKVPDDGWHATLRTAVSATADEVAAFHIALATISPSPSWTLRGSRAALLGIRVGTGVGNSFEDLHLSLYGYKVGRMIRQGAITNRKTTGQWIRTTIGGQLPADTPGRRDTATA